MDIIETLYQAYLENAIRLHGKPFPTDLEMEIKCFVDTVGLTTEQSNKLEELMTDSEAFYERTGFFDGFKLAFSILAEVLAR
ncbi:MAG: hypothetical protein NC394_08495 [Bacteroides sp.]|nr:hypothetical protein [Bacteroides sp.]